MSGWRKLGLLAVFGCAHALVVLNDGTFHRRSVLMGAAAACGQAFAPPAFAAGLKTARVETSWKLANGVVMPTLALNTAGLSADGSERALTAALAAGFTHVDFHPGIERDGVARAIATAGLTKSKDRLGKLFLTTKIAKPPIGSTPAEAAERVRRQIDEDLAVLGVDAVEMIMLRDSPDCDVMRAQWAALDEARAAGRCRAVGTINFCEGSLKCILESTKTKPALNYIMEHVGMGEDAYGLRAFGEARGIRTFAYGALGEPGPSDELLASPVLKRIGEARGRSVEEVALRWVVQRGCAVSVRPTADFGMGASKCEAGEACAAGLKARSQVFDWSLAPSEMAA